MSIYLQDKRRMVLLERLERSLCRPSTYCLYHWATATWWVLRNSNFDLQVPKTCASTVGLSTLKKLAERTGLEPVWPFGHPLFSKQEPSQLGHLSLELSA